VAVETGQYSAKHWATKAQQTAASVNAAEIAAQFVVMQAQITALQNQVNNKPPQRQWKNVQAQRQKDTIYTNTSTQELWVDVGYHSSGLRFSAYVAADAAAPFIKVGIVPAYSIPIIFIVPPGTDALEETDARKRPQQLDVIDLVVSARNGTRWWAYQ